MGAVKACLPDNVRWDDDVLVLEEEPVMHDTLAELDDAVAFKAWDIER